MKTIAWKQQQLDTLMILGNGRDYKHLKKGSIPVYGTGGYITSVNKALCNQDSVGIGRKGTINNPYILKVPFWTVDTLFYATPKNNCYLDFLFGLFKTINWPSLDESIDVLNLSKNNISKVEVTAPKDIKEQESVGQLMAELNNLLTLHLRKQKRLKSLKYISKKGYNEKGRLIKWI